MPKELIEQLKADNFYVKSALSGHRPVQWHHVFTFAGKSIQEPWNIVPLTKDEHDAVTPHKPNYDREADEHVRWIALNRASNLQLNSYSKVEDLIAIKWRLNLKYGKEKMLSV